MLMRKPLILIGMMAAVCSAIFLLRTEDGPVEQVPGPDLFSFVRALPADADEKVVRETPHEQAATESAAPEPAAVTAANAFGTEENVRRMRAHGASDDEVYRARAAATLARLDREEVLWQQRVAAYLFERQANAGNSLALQALKDRLFTLEEQGRLAAYEPAPMPLTGMPQ